MSQLEHLDWHVSARLLRNPVVVLVTVISGLVTYGVCGTCRPKDQGKFHQIQAQEFQPFPIFGRLLRRLRVLQEAKEQDRKVRPDSRQPLSELLEDRNLLEHYREKRLVYPL